MAISSRETTEHPVLNETRARQGRVSHRVIWVLAISTILGFLAVGAAWLFKADDLAAAGNDERSNPVVQSTDAMQAQPPTRPAP